MICPVDGKPCDPDCPDRYTDRPEGGCLMTTLQEHSDSLLLFHPLDNAAQQDNPVLVMFKPPHQP